MAVFCDYTVSMICRLMFCPKKSQCQESFNRLIIHGKLSIVIKVTIGTTEKPGTFLFSIAGIHGFLDTQFLSNFHFSICCQMALKLLDAIDGIFRKYCVKF